MYKQEENDMKVLALGFFLVSNTRNTFLGKRISLKNLWQGRPV